MHLTKLDMHFIFLKIHFVYIKVEVKEIASASSPE